MLSLRVCSDEGLMLETSAIHQTSQVNAQCKSGYDDDNDDDQPLLIKPIFSLLANAEKHFFLKTSLPLFLKLVLALMLMVHVAMLMTNCVYDDEDGDFDV